MRDDARDLLKQLAETGRAPAKKRLAANDLIERGLATKGKTGLTLTKAGEFAAKSLTTG